MEIKLSTQIRNCVIKSYSWGVLGITWGHTLKEQIPVTKKNFETSNNEMSRYDVSGASKNLYL